MLDFFRKLNKKDFFTFFIIILIPNILRQVLYWVTYLITGSTDFIVSFETKAIFDSFPIIGSLEEIAIGVIYALLWFRFKKLKFLSYAWINDALFDFISVFFWFFMGGTPLQLLGFGTITRFFLREIILFYVIIGPLMMKYKLNIKRLSLWYSIIGFIILLSIIIAGF